MDLADGEEGAKEEEEEEISVSYVIRRGSSASSGGGGKNLSKEDKEVEAATEVEKKAVAQNGSEMKVVEVEPEVEGEEEAAAAAAMVSEEARSDETAHEDDEKIPADDKTFNLPAELLDKDPAESMPEEKAEEAAVHGTSDEVQQDVAMPHDGTQLPEEENKEILAKEVVQEKEDKIEEQETKEKEEEEEEEDPSHMHEGKS